MAGWIKLQRDIMDHWIAQDNEYLAVWVRMLAEANFSDRKTVINGALVEVKRGQLVFGLESYSEKTGVSVRRLRKLLELLESDSMIDRQKSNKFSLISIVNYAKHQDDDRQKAGESQADDKQAASEGQAKGNTKRKKELKECEEGNKFSIEKSGKFIQPTKQDVWKYMYEIGKGSETEAEKFVDHYTANGWKVGKNPMKNWEASVRNWTKNMNQFQKVNRGPVQIDQIANAHQEFLNGF